MQVLLVRVEFFYMFERCACQACLKDNDRQNMAGGVYSDMLKSISQRGDVQTKTYSNVSSSRIIY